jgi:hypothetical protein
LRSQPKTVAGPLLVFLLPLLRTVVFVLKTLYKVFFSWWLTPLLEHRFRKEFATEIRLAHFCLPWTAVGWFQTRNLSRATLE